MINGSQKILFCICFGFATFSFRFVTFAQGSSGADSRLFRSTKDDDETRNKPKVALFTMNFGDEDTIQPWLPLFLKSAATSGVDYFIVGNLVPPMSLPPNIQRIPITYDRLVKRISYQLFGGRELGMINSAYYKVNDIKPLLGSLFRSKIKDYDWWGYIDNDMMMGNVRKFLSREMLNNYDVISLNTAAKGGTADGDVFNLKEGQIHVKTWGPCTLYRNVPRVTELYRGIPNLKHVYDTERPMFIDEFGLGEKENFYEYSMSKMVNQRYLEGEIRVFHYGIPIKIDKSFHNYPYSVCIFRQETESDGTVRSKVTWEYSSVHKNHTRQLSLCHLQDGKKKEIFKATAPTVEALATAKAVTYDLDKGFTVQV